MSQAQTLVLVDGSALAFRSFYALFTTGMRRLDGTPTWAVYGFFKALLELAEKQKPDMIAVCFDLAEPTFRHIEYEEYKAHRAEMPDDLSVQWPIIKEGIAALGIPIYEIAGFEADDIIGTVAKKAEEHKLNVLILTGDQDAFQLLDGNIQVLMPGKEGLATFGRDDVFNKLSVWPEQVIDYKALRGDTSDNIPGVKGIGEKTAVQLLTQFKTLKNIYDNIDEVKSKSVKQKLIDGKNDALKSQNLATIRLDVPLEFDFEHCKLKLPDVDKVVAFLRELEFSSILKRLPKMLAPFNGGVAPNIDEGLLLPLSKKNTTKTMFQDNQQLGSSDTSTSRQLSILSLDSPPPVQAEVGSTQIVRTKEELDNLISVISKQSILSVDLETTGLDSLDCQIVGYALAWSPTAQLENGEISFKKDALDISTAYVPVNHRGEEQLEPDYVASKLKPILESNSIGKIAQNAKYEMNVLSLYGIKFGPLVFDPMLASYVHNPDSKHGLKDQSERIFDYHMVRISELIGTGRKQITMEDVPVSKAAPYAADDARITLALSEYYFRLLDQEQKDVLHKIELPLTPVLAKMEQTGVALDLPYLKQFSAELTEELQKLEAAIYEDAGHAFNINSTQQLQIVLFEELKLPVKGKTKTKSGYSTDASVLEALIKDHSIISKILEYRQMSKLRSTYVDALPAQVSNRDNRLHGEFNQTVTSTGRLSSSNPNLQNIPIKTPLGRQIRRAFIPEEKNAILISADYSQIELRLLAHMSGDETLIAAFKNGEDIHAHTAAGIFDLSTDQVDSDMRRIGKTINFSLIYQQGAYSTAKDLGVSPKQAQEFIDKYFARYPKVRTFMHQTIEDAREHGYAKTLWGRRRYFRYLNDRNDNIRKADERAASNAPLQGSAADLMKLAMIKLDQELIVRKLKSKLILQVHDELVLEVPQDEIDQVKETLVAAMELGQPLSVPLKVDVKIGPTWMDVK